jgi:hypothetical protein
VAVQPYQRADLLIRLRNALVHFHSEWVDLKAKDAGDTKLEKLGRRLKAEFQPNPHISPHLPYFPYRCLGSGCAVWAVKSARAFADNFGKRIGIKLEHNLMLQISPRKFDL